MTRIHFECLKNIIECIANIFKPVIVAKTVRDVFKSNQERVLCANELIELKNKDNLSLQATFFQDTLKRLFDLSLDNNLWWPRTAQILFLNTQVLKVRKNYKRYAKNIKSTKNTQKIEKIHKYI